MQPADYSLPLRKRDGSVKAYAVVSPEDYEWASAYKWNFVGKGYVARRVPGGRHVRQSIYLHREVLGLEPGDGIAVDHVNRDKLDNRRENLRVVTLAENNQNLPSHRGSSSRYRNVSWIAANRAWRVQMLIGGVKYDLGYFADEDEAGAAAQAFRAANMSHATD